ncbi:hypothetical protein [Streptomyces brasiliensis]|uniref:Secreted protein n=1 Tax=Streptomyces brasiliensis TaxID=1954 RepID=A0A917KWT7_9ACTN|nr:hypothetical protein [Streptomyces brasiliensis]GGJ31086.1 hypothetical protein GCM10010121_048010 [Streptomyces brasiliensis]
MMNKLLAVVALATPVAALAVPAHASDEWTAADTAACVGDLAVAPVVRSVPPASLRPAPGAVRSCGEGSLIHHGPGTNAPRG